jgi:putative flippase GtrA
MLDKRKVGEVRGATRASVNGRLWGYVRQTRNWLQLARFATVGMSGYIVNLVVFAVCSRALGLHHLAAATAASVAAVSNNFVWNRRWTFAARGGRARRQATRFLVVSVLSFLLAAFILDVLVKTTSLSPVLAQALSIVSAAPFSFLSNKFWTFACEQQD